MRQLKLLLAAIALLWAMPCWGKPIDLHGKWEHKKKSIPIGLPMDASIEEANSNTSKSKRSRKRSITYNE